MASVDAIAASLRVTTRPQARRANAASRCRASTRPPSAPAVAVFKAALLAAARGTEEAPGRCKEARIPALSLPPYLSAGSVRKMPSTRSQPPAAAGCALEGADRAGAKRDRLTATSV